MKRYLGGALALLLLLLPVLAGAQSFTNNGTITANGGTVPLQALSTGAGTIQITGTWTGSITPIECSLDGATYAAVPVTPIAGGATVVTTTGNGMWTFAGAFVVCRARATAAMTGTASINLLVTRARVSLGGLTAPVTPAQGGLGSDFSASTGVLYDAAGTFSAIACTSGLLQGGAPPDCRNNPSISGQFTSTLATGTAPFVVASTTNVANLNASLLGGATFAAPGAIGGGTPSTGVFTGTTVASASNPRITVQNTGGSGRAYAFQADGIGDFQIVDVTEPANRLTISSAGAIVIPISLAIGGSTPTAITNIRVYEPTLTPAQNAASLGLQEQNFTVTGLTTADKVEVNPPTSTALCPPVTYRVSGADTLTVGFASFTAVLCTPAAGVFKIVAIRS